MKNDGGRIDNFRRRIGGYLIEPIVELLVRTRITPNQITFIGLVTVVIGAALIPLTAVPLWASGLIILLGSIMDMFDGAVARRRNMASREGAFLDSTTDRMQEFAILLALVYHFLYVGENAPDRLPALLTLVALFGSLMISYLRGKAESLSMRGRFGLVSRPERVAIIVLFLLISQPVILVWVLAIASSIGALWRFAGIWYDRHRHPTPDDDTSGAGGADE